MDLALADLSHWWMYSSSAAGMGRHTGMSKLLCHEQSSQNATLRQISIVVDCKKASQADDV